VGSLRSALRLVERQGQVTAIGVLRSQSDGLVNRVGSVWPEPHGSKGIPVLTGVFPLEPHRLTGGEGDVARHRSGAEMRPTPAWSFIRIDNSPAFVLVPLANGASNGHGLKLLHKQLLAADIAGRAARLVRGQQHPTLQYQLVGVR
jgi:hypothetical protein